MGLVLLVRHGQASFGADDYDVLSETGWTQARLLGRWLAERGVVPDAVVRGSMRRHRETAEAMTQAAGWAAEPVVDPGWDEFDHVAVVAAYPRPEPADEPLDRRAFQRRFEQATGRWTQGGFDEEYAEPWPAFRDRVAAALDRATEAAAPGGTVVVVSSGGPVAATGARLVDPGADDAGLARMWARLNAVLVNSAVSRVVVGSTGVRLLSWNEHPHLAADTLTYR